MTDDSQRIDKWLWYARFFKTRTVASKYVTAGKVRVNRTRITKPGHAIRPGDVLTFTLHLRPRVVEVLAPGTRRGPADEARALYEDMSPPPPEGARKAAKSGATAQAARELGSGRPTKKERRELDAWLDASE